MEELDAITLEPRNAPKPRCKHVVGIGAQLYERVEKLAAKRSKERGTRVTLTDILQDALVEYFKKHQ